MSSRRLISAALLGAVLLLPSALTAGYIGWPVSATITSPFGPRSNPCSGCSTYHQGVDLGVGAGTNCGAPGNGTLGSYVYDSCGGNMYTINYENGWQSVFMHTSSSIVGSGSITRNTSVAKSGNTGSCSTGAHLHFGMKKDGVWQSIPGAAGASVTRNANVAKDFVGLNDTVSVPPNGPNPTITVTGTGQIYLFGINNSDGAIQWNPTDSSGWHTIPSGTGFQTIKALYNPSADRITVLGISSNGPLYTNTQTGVGGGWAGFVNRGGTINSFDAVMDNNYRIFVVGIADEGTVWRNRQNADGTWTGWTYAAGSTGFSRVRAFAYGDGKVAIFGCGDGTELWTVKENTPGGTWPSSWTNWGGTIKYIDVVKQSTGKPCIFSIASYDGSVWSTFERTDGTYAWHNLTGTGFGLISAVARPNGTLAVFGNAPGPTYLKVQTAVGEDFPSSWSPLGGQLATLSAGVRSSGAMCVMGRALTARTMWWELQPSLNGAWPGFSSLGGTFK